MKNEIIEIDFYKLCEQYEKNLNITLRDFGSEHEYLKFWVPDTDLKKSFCNLIEAFKEIKYYNFNVFLNCKKKNIIDTNFLNNIENNIGKIIVSKNNGNLYLDINIDINKYNNDFQSFLPSNTIKTTAKKFSIIDNKRKVVVEDIDKNYFAKINHLKKFNIDHCYLDYENEIQNYLNNESNLILSNKESIFELKLIINKSNHKIIKCYHNLKNKNHNSILINFFCAYLKGLHIQEAADHAVIYLEHHFRPNDIKYSNGIIFLDHAGTSFRSINTLIRKILSSYRKINDYKDITNNFYTKIGKNWKKLTVKEKQLKIEKTIIDFTIENKIPNNELKFVGIDRNIRVYIQIGKIINNKKNNLIVLENNLKKIEKRLEIFTIETKDSNKLRWKNAPKIDIISRK